VSRVLLREAADADAPAARLWEVVTDWEHQGDWIPLTTVRLTAGDGRGVGSRLEARTGVGRAGVVDTMVVTHWREDPGGTGICEVMHTGRVVRGDGGFEVEALGERRSRVVWWESLDLPLGAVGALGWRAVAPGWRAGTRRALRRLCALAEEGAA
jgi:Polyketide cyclase / dehydrase and lipid transport